MVPSHGATILLPAGLMAIPSPTIFSAKTTSGTSSIGTISPDSGAKISMPPVSELSSETSFFSLSNRPIVKAPRDDCRCLQPILADCLLLNKVIYTGFDFGGSCVAQCLVSHCLHIFEVGVADKLLDTRYRDGAHG